MTIQYALINKGVLTLLREKTHVSFEFLEQSTGKTRDMLLAWEDANSPELPTIHQAKTLARSFRVPFACLYMKVDDITIAPLPNLRNMRTLPNSTPQDDSILNLSIIELIEARTFFIETKTDLNESIPTFSLLIRGSNVSDWANSIRKYFSLDLSIQYKCPSTRQFFLYLKNAVENKGVFIHSMSGVPLDSARGVAIHFDALPIIGVNDSDRPPAKSFSIIHELVHIIKRSSSLCNDMYSSFTASGEEIFCNAVAGEVLVPESALNIFMKNYAGVVLTVEIIEQIAKHFSVSKEVVIRRLLEASPPYISRNEYQTFSDEFQRIYDLDREAANQARKEGHSPQIFTSPSRDAIDRTSMVLSRSILHGYGEGLFDKQDISRYLGIAPRHVDKFLRAVSTWDS